MPDLIPAIGQILPEPRLQAFASARGGIDLRRIKDLCVARYRDATLTVARVPLDQERVANAFEVKQTSPTTRKVLAPNPRVLSIASNEEALLVFGADAVAHDEGSKTPIRVAEAFAFGKLKRAAPALHGAALRRVDALLGDAPIRVFAPGPFEGEMANALGGLLRASTAAAGSVRWDGAKANLAVRFVLAGAWGEDGAAASERLAAAVQLLQESAAGRLFGLDHPVRPPLVRAEPDALIVDATIDGDALARGLRDAAIADATDLFK